VVVGEQDAGLRRAVHDLEQTEITRLTSVPPSARGAMSRRSPTDWARLRGPHTPAKTFPMNNQAPRDKG
jgi:hypothetical protein